MKTEIENEIELIVRTFEGSFFRIEGTSIKKEPLAPKPSIAILITIKAK
jgi:hypothetical protein